MAAQRREGAEVTDRRERVLVVAAHPDDEVLGCGGTMALLARTADVRVLILGEGITSRGSSSSTGSELATLHENARRAGEMLGAKVWLGGMPDNRLDAFPLLDIVRQIEGKLEEFHPTMIFTHFPGDLNIDHRVLFEAVLTAARPLPQSSVREIHCFEVRSATEWSFGRVNGAFTPQLFYDISSTLELKLQALEQYSSEMRPFPHPRSLEGVRAAALQWGATVGIPAAEAFMTVRMTRP